MKGLKDVQHKYDFFLEKYEQGIKKHVPLYIVKGKKEWFNAVCVKAKEKRDKAWKRMKRKSTERNRGEYKLARNEYVRIRRGRISF